MSNSFGNIFRFTTFGESHGKAIGGIIDGVPAGQKIDYDFINSELEKRKPGQNQISSSRKEADKVEFISGLFNNTTTGSPIAFIIKNNDTISKDYENLKDVFRPGHADYSYWAKYGFNDWRGGGRASARETAVRVVAGAIAKIFLKKFNIQINAFTSQIGEAKLNIPLKELDFSQTFKNSTRCPDYETHLNFQKIILKHKSQKDSIGGIVSCLVKNVPLGLGEPIYDKISARLAYAIMSINACKGFEIGKGLEVAQMKGSENNDQIQIKNNKIKFLSNNAGGTLGGISTGQDIFFRAAFKPTPSIAIKQNTIDKKLQNVSISIKGRHDPCVVPRAVIVVEAMTAVTLLDFILLKQTNKLF